MSRVVVVTGASAGVGRATAIEFAKTGASVALIARGRAGLEGAARQVEEAGGRAFIIQADVADHQAVDDAAARVENELGPIDVWVNAAFSSVFATFLEIKPEEFERTTQVSYIGYVNGTRAALKRMHPRDKGVIIQVGSALSYRGIPLQSAYCGSKHAIQGFNEAVRSELLHQKSKVHTTMVVLPAVNTPQFKWVLSRLPKQAQPVPPIYQPEVPARVIVKAATKYRREWWVGWSTVGTVIANQLFPGVLDRYLARTGFSSQQTDLPRDPNQPVNLFTPADEDEDFGTHGSFDKQAKSYTTQTKMSEHHRLVAAGAALAATALTSSVRRSRTAKRRK